MPAHRALVVVFLSVWLFTGLSRPVFAQWITFPASRAEIFGESGERAAGHASYPVRAFLSVPVDAGRHPAIVLLPSCEGRKPYHQSWAQALSERGFVALLVDDYFMYDRDQTCGITNPDAKADLLQLRLLHALGATRYLLNREEVDGTRIAVMGWGDAPVSVLLVRGMDADAKQVLFRAGVTVTPPDCDDFGRTQIHPLLILRSESDSAASGDTCRLTDNEPALEVRTYQGTSPGFDDPQAGSGETSGADAPETGARRYNRLAHARAIEDVVEFLNRRVPPGASDAAHGYATAPAVADPEIGAWAIDPREPGPDLPPAGGSTFDAVFSRVTPAGVIYDVPFPFQKLLQKLEYAAGAQSMSRPAVEATLIPLGRSLQREAAAPDYFRSPRIVVAVTGEPESGHGPPGIRLNNRLFLGYQPRSNIVEVISYNEEASRFEFQVVKNYGSGREPGVYYARRALCTSCHQNAGPMFSEASWDETNANLRVVNGLRELGAEFLGIPVVEDDRSVSSIDAATDAANLLPVYHRLWVEGCSSFLQVEVARCRAGAFQAMVQYRLSNSAGFSRTDALYANGYLPSQRANWNERWPDGLLIPNPNLPDRSPLMSPSPSAVSVALDPLRQRGPLARWHASSNRDLDRMIRGLSHYLPDRHMRSLDKYLRASSGTTSSSMLTTTCTAIWRGFAGRARQMEIDCGNKSDRGAGFHMEARITVTPDGDAGGEVRWLEVDGAIYARRTLAGRVDDPSDYRISLRLTGDRDEGIRAPDGNSLLGLTLIWDQGASEKATRFEVTGVLTIASDFKRVRTTLERLAAAASESSPLLSERFDGVRLANWLLAELGIKADDQCCESRPMPAPRLDDPAQSTDATLTLALEHHGPMLTFRRYCGACHGGNTAFPPGFLFGEGKTLVTSIAQCAERILYRLSMWDRRTEDQVVPPMPPVQGLSLTETTIDNWRQGEALARLTAYTRKLLLQDGNDPDAVLGGNYHATRACISDRDKRKIAMPE